jgi:hypothetical protein
MVRLSFIPKVIFTREKSTERRVRVIARLPFCALYHIRYGEFVLFSRLGMFLLRRC